MKGKNKQHSLWLSFEVECMKGQTNECLDEAMFEKRRGKNKNPTLLRGFYVNVKCTLGSLSLLHEAVTAKYWPIAFWLKRNCTLFTAFSTDDWERLSWSAHISSTTLTTLHTLLFCLTTIFTTNWGVIKAFLCVKFLLRCGPSKFLATISTCECFILKCHLGFTSDLHISFPGIS